MSQLIRESISESLNRFFSLNWNYKDFLTEDDIRCRLFCHLQSDLVRFPNVSVHSEIRWYGDDAGETLKYRSDIVIIDHDDLEVLENDNLKLPSKGYGFNNYHAIIEIKLRRMKCRDSNVKFDEKITSDVEKLQVVYERTRNANPSSLYYVLFFDKKRKFKKMIKLNDTNPIQNDWLS